MDRTSGLSAAIDSRRGESQPTAASVQPPGRALSFPTGTVDEHVLENRYRSALAAWKDAVRTADPDDPRDRQRLELLQKAYLESLSAYEEARKSSAAHAERVRQMREQRMQAERKAEMVLSQSEAWASACEGSKRRPGLLGRLFRRR